MNRSNLKRPLIISIIVVLLGITLGYVHFNNNKLDKYLIISEILHIDDKAFEKSEKSFSAVNLGKLIGKTDEGQQVYEIEGLNPDEWICVRTEGRELVYRKKELYNQVEIADLNIDKIDIKERDKLCGIKNTVADTDVINEVMLSMNDENLVDSTIIASQAKELVLYSTDYPGLCYLMYIIHDETNGYFIYDKNEETVWKLDTNVLEKYL